MTEAETPGVNTIWLSRPIRVIDRRAEVIVLWPESPSEPFISRGYCYCNSPVRLERRVDIVGWTFYHGDVALVSARESWIMRDIPQHQPEETAGAWLLRDAITQLHSWVRA